MKVMILILGLINILISPISYALCFGDNIQDTQSFEDINTARNITRLNNQIYHEPQFGSTLGELEHDSHSDTFKAAWPKTTSALNNVPSQIENTASGEAILSKLGNAASTTMEVLGPIGDAVAVGAWLNNVVETFSEESATNLDKTAAIFSILPLVGDELNALSNDIKYFSAKQKVEEFEQQKHYVFSNFSAEFTQLHHRKEDAINLLNKYDQYLDLTISMYVDQLLLIGDTEYRRIAAAYDRQLAKQMARMDLELLKTLGHVSENTTLHQPLCQPAQATHQHIVNCIKNAGPIRINQLIDNLNNAENHRLSANIFNAKQRLVAIVQQRLVQHRDQILNTIIARAKHHVQNIRNHASINRSYLLDQARKSGLREYAKAYWNIDYLSEEQLNTATFEVQPARECWGVPSVYPGGIQDSLDACKDSGAIYDTYHIKKDPELAKVLHYTPKLTVEQIIYVRLKRGWPKGLLKHNLNLLAQAYVSGHNANDIFQSLISLLPNLDVPPFQTPYHDYLTTKGIDNTDPAVQKNWYQLSRWYEYILTEKPYGGAISNLTQYFVFIDYIKPIFEQTISAAYVRDLYYTVPFPNLYPAKYLRFHSPIMADIFDQILHQANSEYPITEQDAVEYIMQLVSETQNANELHYLLGDLAVFAQIAQHQQSESNIGLLANSQEQSYQLFVTRLSPLHESYLLAHHTAALEQQHSNVINDPLWQTLAAIKPTLQQGNLADAIQQLGAIVQQDKFPLLPHINEWLLNELEQWIDLQITLEESA